LNFVARELVRLAQFL